MELVRVRTGRRWIYDESDFQLLVSPEPPSDEEAGEVVWRRISDFTDGRGSDCAMIRGSSLQAGLESVEAELDDEDATQDAAPDVDAAQAYQLKRWPPRALLSGDARRQRLATLLLSRPMTLEELASASGVSEQECSRLIARLKKAALLTRREPEQTAARPDESSNRGLLSMIRKRLGIDRRVD